MVEAGGRRHDHLGVGLSLAPRGRKPVGRLGLDGDGVGIVADPHLGHRNRPELQAGLELTQSGDTDRLSELQLGSDEATTVMAITVERRVAVALGEILWAGGVPGPPGAQLAVALSGLALGSLVLDSSGGWGCRRGRWWFGGGRARHCSSGERHGSEGEREGDEEGPGRPHARTLVVCSEVDR